MVTTMPPSAEGSLRNVCSGGNVSHKREEIMLAEWLAKLLL
jgi:hypothetical protein